jgi:beta-lactamase class C
LPHEFAYPHSARKNDQGIETLKTLPFPPYYPKTATASAGIFASIDGMIEFFKLAFGYRPDLISQKTLDVIYTPKATANDVFYWNLDFPYDQKNITSKYAPDFRSFCKGEVWKAFVYKGCKNLGTTLN